MAVKQIFMRNYCILIGFYGDNRRGNCRVKIT